jgi:hypothetical protein
LSTRLLVPANITIILLPPKCPETQPGRERLAVHARQGPLNWWPKTQPTFFTLGAGAVCARHGENDYVANVSLVANFLRRPQLADGAIIE